MFKKIARTADYLPTNDLEIILTGPFQTGNPLDFSQTKTDEYRKIQEAIRDKMVEVFPHYMWEIPKSGEGQKYEMGAGGTGKAHSPSYYLECIMDCKQIKCNFKEYNFTIKRMQIKFYEFGFATVSIFGMISLKGSRKNNTKVSPSDLLCIVNDLDEKIVNGEVQQIKALTSNVVKRYNKTIKENKIQNYFDNEKANIGISNIRSLHRIFQYKVKKSSEIKDAQKALGKIAKLSNGKWQRENSFYHFVGIANSGIVYNHNVSKNCKTIDSRILNQYKEAYETVLETANAYYFIAEFMKNGLFDYSKEFVAIDKPKYVFKNRKKFNEVQEKLNEFVLLSSNFSSAFDEFISNLSPQGKNIWNEMDKKWNTNKAKQTLQDQLQSSLQITGRILQQISNNVKFWLTQIALSFTIIGAISLVEIARSDGFRWRFHIDIWNSESTAENVGDLTSQIINLIGSILAIALIAVVIIMIVVVIARSICWLVRALGRMAFNRCDKN